MSGVPPPVDVAYPAATMLACTEFSIRIWACAFS
jgi:hypothetical protein